MPNRLANATSPYLLQHRDNPVDWYEWGDEAFDAARERDVPIILSVGYAACHWCHVMAHESFEDGETAAYLNRHFVGVKVDREERPDVDRVYMDAVTSMTGRGGWPMTVFLTPDARPFYAGTYFPKTPRHGMPSFMEILTAVADAWQGDRETLLARADEMVASIDRPAPAAGTLPTAADLDAAVDAIAATFDPLNGGFGRAPKFPQPSLLEFLLRYGVLHPGTHRASTAIAIVEVTLDRMARGGIYDHVTGGFARYSVDERWLVPHFEKMLYDNALLARIYLRAWQVTGHPWMLRVARETLDYLERDMRDPSGGLHSAEDADAGGVEGAHAVWTWEELGDVLGSDRDLAAAIYGATPDGNFAGANILHRFRRCEDLAADLGLPTDELAARRAAIDERLRRQRASRTRPERDDKIVTVWNGLALRAFAEAGAVLADERYLATARGIASFLSDVATGDDGILRSWRRGRSGPDGFCDDYAAASIGFLTLYQATGEERWYADAERLTRTMVERFAAGDGGFYATPDGGDRLIARPKNTYDSPVPSDNALAAEALMMLAAYTGKSELAAAAEATIRSVGPGLSAHPGAHGHMLAVHTATPTREVAVVGAPDDRTPFTRVVWNAFRPDTILAAGTGTGSAVPLLAGRTADAGARAFVCRGFVCDLPAETPSTLEAQLDVS